MERNQQRKITRNRELRACTECRKRKLKCDRQFPCASCTRRNEAASCVYERNLGRPQSEHDRRLQAEARLQHLERLVQELSQSSQASVNHKTIPSPNPVQHAEDDIRNDSLYNGETHWSAMLEDIEELRTTMRDSDDVDGTGAELDSREDHSTSLLFGAAKPLSFQQVLFQFLPSRTEADRLVAAYFRAKAVAVPFLHAAQFSRLYRLFWDDPPTASPLWTSILFSVFHVATKTISTNLKANTGEDRDESPFATAAAHCLAVGEYYRPQRFAVEALLLYAQSKCIASVDISPVVATVFGTLVRLATASGYHRDADRSREGLSSFEKEMRRRTWSVTLQLDMLVSFQFGLPSNVQFPTWDTKPPTNLLDLDFDEDTVLLPPARPESEPTELLFYIAKHRLMTVFEKIIRHTLSTIECPIDELEAIDRELRDTYAALPVVYQARPMADSIVDPPSVIVARLCVFFIYQKCRCVLHRKYVTHGRRGSIQICHASASDLIKRFLDIAPEFGPGGQLETERWFIGSITWHDFLLSCTTLCLTICAAKRTNTASVNVVSSLELLQNAKALCEKQSARSKDTRKVQRLIRATVMKFNDQEISGDQETVPSEHWLTMSASHDEQNSIWKENVILLGEDPTWAYMEQFLNLPSEDSMIDA